jgi:hypothetical protein
MGRVANARDYRRPLDIVQLEVQKNYMKLDISLKYRKMWDKKVLDIYNGNITSKEVWAEIHAVCEKIPGTPW